MKMPVARRDPVRVLRVFVASPGDVSAERDRVEDVVEELNRTTALQAGVRLEVLRWESSVAPLMGRPQQVILNQLPIEAMDVFVGILWHRFGSSTGGAMADGTPFISGTEEEFMLAYQAWQEKGSPQILFYRCTKPPPDITSIDPHQYVRVTDFLSSFSHGGSHPGLVRTFQTLQEFERRLREDLGYLIHSLAPSAGSTNVADLTPALRDNGFENLYVPNTNEARDAAKIATIRRANDLRLIAHSGYSYLALVGHRFRNFVEERLAQGGRFRIILANPWGETGLFIALGERDTRSGDPLMRKIFERGGFADLDVVQTITSSTWYSLKLRDAMRGYSRLRESFGERIEARYWLFEMPATILLTEYECYWEPYLNVDLQDRLTRDMLTFEVRVDTRAHIYHHAERYFDFLWRLSLPAEILASHESDLKQRLRDHLTIPGMEGRADGG